MNGLSTWALAALAAAALGACRDPGYREVEIDLTGGLATAPAAAVDPARTLRVSVAAIQSPASTFVSYSRLFERMERLLDLDIQLVQRRTYREVNDLLLAGRIDVAFVCTGGYLDLERRAPGAVEVLAVPLARGLDTYRSVIIVSAAGPIRRLEDLGGRRFAFTDELSLTGYAWPVHRLRELGAVPDTFFGATVLTHGHERSIQAVARGVVDGAAVGDQVYEAVTGAGPLGRSLRVIERSPPYGGPPVVASTRLPAALRRRLQQALLDLPADPEAAAALGGIHTDRFVAPSPGLYRSAAAMAGERGPARPAE